MPNEIIVSQQNPKIKNVVALREKSKERNRQKLFPVEGRREIDMALAGGYTIESLFVCPELAEDSYFYANRIYEVNRRVFDKIAYREDSDGLLALMKMKSCLLHDLKISTNPFIIILEAIEKPGNLGAILRTADAADVDAVIVCDPRSDLFNSNVIRSSLGCVFTVNTLASSSEETFRWLNENNIAIYVSDLEASTPYCNEDYTRASAIVMGTESTGVSDFWLKRADKRIKIPMKGRVDSLNVSVSTAIITFEAMRQRG
jgi:TrmH family RNA methyltransferase